MGGGAAGPLSLGQHPARPRLELHHGPSEAGVAGGLCTDEDAEARRGTVACPGSPTEKAAELGLDPGPLTQHQHLPARTELSSKQSRPSHRCLVSNRIIAGSDL